MRSKKVFKKALSLILCAIMVFGTMPLASHAVQNEDKNTQTNADVSINTNNDFSRIVTAKVESEDDNSPYGVEEIIINNNKATVKAAAPDNSTLIVAVYNENEKMLGYGIQSADSEHEEYTVSLENVSFPEHYILKGFLVNKNNAAICKEYVNREKTVAYENFLALTVDDFDSEYVLNFDDDKTNNFAVLTNGTVIAETQSGVNVLESCDETTDTYVISNADSTVKSLKKGDVFYLKTGDENADFIIVEVSSLTTSGDTVTIVSGEETVESVFDCIKINSGSGLSEKDIDNAKLGSALTLVEEEKSGIAPCKADVNVDSEIGNSEEMSTEIEYEANDNFSIKGTLTFSFEAAVKVYYDKKLFKEDYFEYSFKHEEKLEVGVTVTGKLAPKKDDVKIEIGKIPIAGTPVIVEVNVYPVLEFSASGEFVVSVTQSFTQTYNPKDGERKYEYKDKDWDVDLKEKISVKIGFGLEIEVSFLKILKVVTSAEATLEASGEVDNYIKCLLDKYHYCDQCVEGEIEIGIKIEIAVVIQIGKSEKLKWTPLAITPLNFTVKISDFYVSRIDGNKTSGFSKCPNKMHKVSFEIYVYSGTKRIPVEGATIALGGGQADTDGDKKLDSSTAVSDKDGKACGYYKNGNYTVTASVDGYQSKSTSFVADSSTITQKIVLSKDGSSETPNPGEPSNPTNPSLPSGTTLTISGTGNMDNYTGFGLAPWNSYKDKIEHIVVESGVTSLGDYAFAQCVNLKTIAIADTVTDIGTTALYQCDLLQSVYLPDNVKKINDYAFYGCRSMTTLSLGSVEAIGSYAFAQCTALKSVIIPVTTISIGDSAFAWCQNLETIEIKNKDCTIYDSSNTIYVDTAINAPIGSKAQTYANKYGRKFSSISTQSFIDTTNVYDSLSFTYSLCLAETDYILLNVTGYSDRFEIDSSNLEFITQLTADSNGTINANFIPKNIVDDNTTLLIGDFGSGTETKIMTTKLVSTNVEIDNNPGVLTVNYQEGVRLTVSVINPIDGNEIQWYVNGTPYCNGDTFEYKHINSEITITAKLVDVNGNPIMKDKAEIAAEETIKVNAGFFQKIIAFFKFTLFGQVVLRTN